MRSTSLTSGRRTRSSRTFRSTLEFDPGEIVDDVTVAVHHDRRTPDAAINRVERDRRILLAEPLDVLEDPL